METLLAKAQSLWNVLDEFWLSMFKYFYLYRVYRSLLAVVVCGLFLVAALITARNRRRRKKGGK